MKTLLLQLNRHFVGRLLTTSVLLALSFEAYWTLNGRIAPRFDLLTAVDRAIPFVPWTLVVYSSFYVLLLAAAWACEPEEFVRMMAALLLANVLCYAGFLLLPAQYPRPELAALSGSVWYDRYRDLWSADKPGNTFPSLHVAITLLVGMRMRLKSHGALWATWTILICLSTLTAKQHFVVDVLGGAAVALLTHALAFRPEPRPAQAPPSEPLLPEPIELPPPGALNLFLATAILASGLCLQWLAARQSSMVAVLAIGVIYAFLFLPQYSLIHEAEHRVFHADARVNDGAGVLLAAFFPGSFTFLRACHLGHHRRNRSEAERFDLYYPNESLAWRRAYFYTMYLGAFWLAVPLATVVLLLWPGLLRRQLIQDSPSTSAMVNGIPQAFLRRIRLECAGVVLLHVAVFFALDLKLSSFLILYALAGVNWSAQQYITHAASPRHVLNGAHNLIAHPLYERLLLNFNWHLAHHQHPKVPWIHLPRFDDPTRVRPGYLTAFIRFWRGPQPCHEPPPGRAQEANQPS